MNEIPTVEYDRLDRGKPGSDSAIALAVSIALTVVQLVVGLTPILWSVLGVSNIPCCGLCVVVLLKYVAVVYAIADAGYEGRPVVSLLSKLTLLAIVVLDGGLWIYIRA
ncbi:MAG: hypothetical protein AAGD32_13075 [Planctomycetota bacterium]